MVSKPEAQGYAHHGFFPFQAIQSTFSHPGVEHLRLVEYLRLVERHRLATSCRRDVLVLHPGVYVLIRRNTAENSAEKTAKVSHLPPGHPPLYEAYIKDNEETDPDQTDPEVR